MNYGLEQSFCHIVKEKNILRVEILKNMMNVLGKRVKCFFWIIFDNKALMLPAVSKYIVHFVLKYHIKMITSAWMQSMTSV